MNLPERQATLADSVGLEVWALRALGLVAALASLFLVGQAAARSAATSAGELSAMVNSGISRRERTLASVAPVAVVSLIGSIVGFGGAWLASAWFPLGTASMYEPAPGRSLAITIPGAVALATVAASVLAAAGGAWSATSAGRRTAPQRSMLARRVSSWGAPVPAVVGVRFALERGAGPRAVPVRSTLLAVAAGVAGLVATLTFSAGLEDAIRDPQRWGATWDLVSPTGANGASFVEDPDALADAYRATDGVTAAVRVASAVVEHGDRTVALWSLPAAGEDRIVVTGGRAPVTDDEILLGPTTARRWDVAAGDTVELVGAAGRGELRVVGAGLTPSGTHSEFDDSAWVSARALDELIGGPEHRKEEGILIWSDRGVDEERLTGSLTEVASELGAPPPFPGTVPGKINALERVGALPRVLGVFVVVLGIGALAHGLTTTIARRRGELAVLAALGMTPRQTRSVSFTQALTVGLIGLLVGVPTGLVVGRSLWRLVASATPVEHLDPEWFPAVAVALPATIVLALLLAVWPARRAARTEPASVLLAE